MASSSSIAKLLSDNTVDFNSPEAREALTEYFGNTSSFQDFEDWSSEDEDNWTTVAEEENEQACEDDEAEDQGSIIQPPVLLNRAHFPASDTEEGGEMFSSNAGKADKKLSAPLTCKCQLFDGQPCYLRFTSDELLELRMHHLSVEKHELDAVVLSQLSSSLKCGEKTNNTKRGANTDRKKVRSQYRLHGFNICRTLFELIHGIGKDMLDNLMKHYRVNGLVARQHGNKNRLPKHALTFNQQQKVVQFVQNYAETHGILLPGRIPGYSRDDLKLLPCDSTKSSVYNDYARACDMDMTRRVAKRTFLHLWKTFLPDILPMRPKTDLCWQCQKNNNLFQGAGTLTDEDKMEAATNALQHLAVAKKEREEYKAVTERAKNDAKTTDVTKLQEPGSNLPNCSRPMLAHYSFDYAQQVHYPSNPLQPGPVFFKTPRKCGIFGMMTEAIPQMVLFLVDESVASGKGANAVISMVDYFLENYGLKETHCHLHADNCAGQNKNNAMLHYLLWRVMTGRHQTITLSFLLAGHTKFAPDGCFGLFKRRFRKTKVNCLQDIAAVASAASTSGVLIPQLCGDEYGHVLVPSRQWTTFFEKPFHKLIGLKKFHHFQFKLDDDNTPVVYCREYVDSEVQVFHLLKEPYSFPEGLPAIIQPTGLSQQRQEYLFNEIREFVDVEKQDLVCPAPPGSSTNQANASLQTASVSTLTQSSGILNDSPAPGLKTPGRPKKKKRGLGARKQAE